MSASCWSEDKLTNQEVDKGILQRLGWHVDVSCNGRQALQALETRPYDLVLMDVQMPEVDGFEATLRIRNPQSPVLNHNIPIIALTAHAMAGDAGKCLAGGMSDYITKPIDPQILAEVVEKWLVRKMHHGAGGTPIELPKGGKAQSAPSRASLVFKSDVFVQRMMGDKDSARMVAAGFLANLPKVLTVLKEQVSQENIESVWKHAHKIKGSAANVGGEALKDVAFAVEKAGKAGDLAGLACLIPELELQSTRLKEALQQWVN